VPRNHHQLSFRGPAGLGDSLRLPPNHIPLPEKDWKDLANRIEELITGQGSLFAYPEEIEQYARLYAKKVIRYQGGHPFGQNKVNPVAASFYVEKPDYHKVDINTLENEHPRPVGA